MGLCFSKNFTEKVPGSFRGIAKALVSQGLSAEFKHADLRPWAMQGLLMPNVSLTTEKGKSNAHKKIWGGFTRGIIRKLCARRSLFAMLWGKDAQTAFAGVMKGHRILEWSHPSPLADNSLPAAKKFINCTNFKDAGSFVWDNAKPIICFTDGSCAGNGTKGARGKFGVVLVGGHLSTTRLCGKTQSFQYYLSTWDAEIEVACKRRLSARLARLVCAYDPREVDLQIRTDYRSTPVTNNRSELLGLCWGLLSLLEGCAFGRVTVYSDSDITVKTINEWLPTRRKKGTVHELKNPDLLCIAEALLTILRRRCAGFSLRHVRAAHKRAKPAAPYDLMLWHGNNVADRLCADEIPLPPVHPELTLRQKICLSRATKEAVCIT
jgi:ribonuclease HI